MSQPGRDCLCGRIIGINRARPSPCPHLTLSPYLAYPAYWVANTARPYVENGTLSLVHSATLIARVPCPDWLIQSLIYTVVLTCRQCNREWPCNHCQKRKVAEKCRFLHAHAVSERSPPDTTLSRKRPLGRQDPPESVDADEDEDEDDDDDDDDDFEALGYGSSHLFANLNPYSEVRALTHRLDLPDHTGPSRLI